MKIIAFSNVQMHLDPIKEIRDEVINSDLILLIGNITRQGTWIEAKKVVDILKLLNPNIYGVMGSFDSETVQDFLESEGLSLHGQGRKVKNIGFYGLGAGNRTLFHRPFEIGEKEVSLRLEEGYRQIQDPETIILVSHTSPYNSKLDEISMAKHVGSRMIRSFIFKHPPNIFLSSSVDRIARSDRFGMTYLASPGPFETGDYLVIDTEDKDHHLIIKNAYDPNKKTILYKSQ